MGGRGRGGGEGGGEGEGEGGGRRERKQKERKKEGNPLGGCLLCWALTLNMGNTPVVYCLHNNQGCSWHHARTHNLYPDLYSQPWREAKSGWVYLAAMTNVTDIPLLPATTITLMLLWYS